MDRTILDLAGLPEPIDPSRVFGCRDADEARRFVMEDQRIRAGLCPNGCEPPMRQSAGYQDCTRCGFFTNVRKATP